MSTKSQFLVLILIVLLYSYGYKAQRVTFNASQWKSIMLEASFAVDASKSSGETYIPYSTTLRGGSVKSNYISIDPETGKAVLNPSGSKAILEGITSYTGLEFEITHVYSNWGDPKNDLNDTQTGGLMTGEVDIGMNMYAHCCDRYLLHDFADTLELRQFIILFRQPEIATDIFMSQFNLSLWVHLALFIIVLVVVMHLMGWIERRHFMIDKKDIGVNEERDMTFGSLDTISWAFCFVSQQGHDVEPASISMKLVFFLGFFMGLVTFAGFSANIVTTLTSAKSIESFQELLCYDGITILGSAFPPWQQEIREFAKLDGKEDIRTLVSRIDQTQEQALCKVGLLSEQENGHPVADCDTAKIQALADKSLPEIATINPGFWVWEPESNEFNHNRKLACELSYFKVPIGDQLSSFGLRRGLPQAHTINRGILRLRETGVLQKIWQVHENKRPACADFTSVQFKQVSYQHVYGAYVLLGCGYGLAVVISAIEKLTHRPQGQKD